MDSDKLWRTFWSLVAIGFLILAIYAGAHKEFALCICYTFLGWIMRAISEYGFD